MTLTPQEESFCAAYAEGASGAEAARLANYSAANARNQASRMLTRPEVAERVAELTIEFVQRRARRQEELAARLDRIYDKAAAAGDDDGVLQVIELQSRILGFVKTGGHMRSTFQQRTFERLAHARAEEERSRIQQAWDEFDEEERERELEAEVEEEVTETEPEPEAEEVVAEPVPEPSPETAMEPVVAAEPAPVPQATEPEPEPEPEPVLDGEPAKASISQQSSPALSLDELLRGTANAKRRYRERQNAHRHART